MKRESDIMSDLMYESWAQVVSPPSRNGKVVVVEVMPFSIIPPMLTGYYPIVLKGVTDEMHEYLQERYGNYVENWTKLFKPQWQIIDNKKGVK